MFYKYRNQFVDCIWTKSGYNSIKFGFILMMFIQFIHLMMSDRGLHILTFHHDFTCKKSFSFEASD